MRLNFTFMSFNLYSALREPETEAETNWSKGVAFTTNQLASEIEYGGQLNFPSNSLRRISHHPTQHCLSNDR